MEALFDTVKLPFELSLSLLCQDNGELQNGEHSVSDDGGALTTGSIVIDGLIADDKQKKLIAKVFFAFY